MYKTAFDYLEDSFEKVAERDNRAANAAAGVSLAGAGVAGGLAARDYANKMKMSNLSSASAVSAKKSLTNALTAGAFSGYVSKDKRQGTAKEKAIKEMMDTTPGFRQKDLRKAKMKEAFPAMFKEKAQKTKDPLKGIKPKDVAAKKAEIFAANKAKGLKDQTAAAWAATLGESALPQSKIKEMNMIKNRVKGSQAAAAGFGAHSALSHVKSKQQALRAAEYLQGAKMKGAIGAGAATLGAGILAANSIRNRD